MNYANFIKSIVFLSVVLLSNNIFAADVDTKYPITKDVSTQGGIIEPVIVRKPMPQLKSQRTQRSNSKTITRKGQKESGVLIEPTGLD